MVWPGSIRTPLDHQRGLGIGTQRGEHIIGAGHRGAVIEGQGLVSMILLPSAWVNSCVTAGIMSLPSIPSARVTCRGVLEPHDF